jgi:hypothetical protein
VGKLDDFSLSHLATTDRKKLLGGGWPEDPSVEAVDGKHPRTASMQDLSSQLDPVLVANGGLTWFKYFHPDVQAQIYALFTIYRFAPGQLICKRGDWVHGMHVIVRGGAYVSDDMIDLCGVGGNGTPVAQVGEKTGNWLQLHEMINAHILEGAIAAAARTELRTPSNGENSINRESSGGDGVASAAALGIGHVVSQVTIVAAEEDTYDSDSTSDEEEEKEEEEEEEEDARSVVMTREPSMGGKSGGCTTMYLDAKRVRDVLIRAIEAGRLYGGAKTR